MVAAVEPVDTICTPAPCSACAKARAILHGRYHATVADLAAENVTQADLVSFLGGGVYDSIIPAACDAIVSPVAPTPAYPIGATLDDPLTMYLSDVFTLSANLAGIPGISVPCGFSDDGLPIGLQIMGRHFNESMLFKVDRQYEQAVKINEAGEVTGTMHYCDACGALVGECPKCASK